MILCIYYATKRMRLQVLGTVIIGAGAWLALDKNSLLSILRLVKNENIEVSNTNTILHDLFCEQVV